MPRGRPPLSLPALIYEPKLRGIILQVLLVVALAVAAWSLASNVAVNLQRQNIASGFDFLDRTAGFEISQQLIEFKPTDSYGRAFVVGLLNTLLVAGLGIVLATILGFTVGVARLSSNWIVSRLALAFVEVVRNMPPLLTLFLVYFAAIKTLPGPRQSIALPLSSHLNVRGLYMPKPQWLDGSGIIVAAVAVGVAAARLLDRWARRRQVATGQQFRMLWPSLALVLGLPLLAFLTAGQLVAFDYPQLKGFNFSGGLVLTPEFATLLFGLSIYTAAFIAEIVRAGVLSVRRGQWEAAFAVGFKSVSHFSQRFRERYGMRPSAYAAAGTEAATAAVIVKVRSSLERRCRPAMLPTPARIRASKDMGRLHRSFDNAENTSRGHSPHSRN